MARKNSRPVYSTELGRLCSGCGQPASNCRCKDLSAAARAGDGIVRLRRESKGRGGKTVTIIEGLPGDQAALKAEAKRLKRLCGVGGSLKDRTVEIQGDHRERLAERLRQDGHQVKLAGG